jgi:hypothetical protein
LVLAKCGTIGPARVIGRLYRPFRLRRLGRPRAVDWAARPVDPTPANWFHRDAAESASGVIEGEHVEALRREEERVSALTSAQFEKPFHPLSTQPLNRGKRGCACINTEAVSTLGECTLPLLTLSVESHRRLRGG